MNKKNLFINLGIIVVVGLIAILIIYLKSCSGSDYPREVVECISTNSILYVQKGCHYCKIQEDKFGKNKELLNIIDCFYEGEKCLNIISTPTWVINGTFYRGVYEIDELKNMTGCLFVTTIE